MKKSIILILSMLIIAPTVISGCGENTQPTVDSSQAESTESNETLTYTLNEDLTFGSLTFKVDNRWEKVLADDERVIIKITDLIGLYANKIGYAADTVSEEDMLDSFAKDYSIHSYDVIDGKKVLLYTDISSAETSSEYATSSRHIMVIVNNGIYDIYCNGSQNSLGECEKVISDIFNTLSITTEELTASPTESTTEEETEAPDTEQLLIDENDVKIYYKGIGGEWSGPTVELRIENNSNKDYTVQARDVSVNGYMISPIFSCTVSGKKSANDGLSFLQSRLDENGIEAFHNVELSFHVFNKDDWDDYFDTEKVTIEI